MTFRDAPPTKNTPRLRTATISLVLLASLGLSACGNKEKTAQGSGQSLVKVNGQEITIHQLNDELMRTNVPAPQQEAARKQLLESLIDRQLLEDEALRDKMDRDPQVMAALERAKSQMVAQAYLQKRVASLPKPSDAEIAEYFKQHPELFAERKVFEMDQLMAVTGAQDAEFKERVQAAKSLDELTAWLDARGIKFGRTRLVRSGADLPPDLLKRVQAMRAGQMFMIKEGERQMVVALAAIRPAPVTAHEAAPMITQYLTNVRAKEAAGAEMARLRASAKIEYLNQSSADASAAAPQAGPGSAAPVSATSAAAGIERGVTGLK